MRESRIPTLLAIFILIIALTSFVFIASQIQNISTGAESSIAPQDVRITNIKDTSFTVSWLTDKPTSGFVSYTNASGESANSNPTNSLPTHFVTIQNLHPGTSYSFKINSGGVLLDNNGAPWQTQTQNSITPNESKIVSGQVVDSNRLPAKNALVYVSANGINYSTQVTQSGSFLLALPSTDDSTNLQVLVEVSGSVISTAKINLGSANPIPTIVAGKSYDFVDQIPQATPDIPKVQIQL